MPRATIQEPSSVADSINTVRPEYRDPGPTNWPSRAGMLRYTSNLLSPFVHKDQRPPVFGARLRLVELDGGVQSVLSVVFDGTSYVGLGQVVVVQCSGLRRRLRHRRVRGLRGCGGGRFRRRLRGRGGNRRRLRSRSGGGGGIRGPSRNGYLRWGRVVAAGNCQGCKGSHDQN